jgi:hypothetical protein
MEKRVIEKFLKNNPIDDRFYLGIYYDELEISDTSIDFNLDINIKTIISMGINYKNIFFETKFGRFEFRRAEKLDILKKAFGEGVK